MFNYGTQFSIFNIFHYIQTKNQQLFNMSYKPIIEKLDENPGQSFSFKKVVRPKRPDFRTAGVWHYHTDFEITLTIQSSGKRFVGYNIDDYSPNELVLLGENLPHCWITDQFTEQYVINFKKEKLGEAFWNNIEFSNIKSLLTKSQHGLKFCDETTKRAIPVIFRMEQLNGIDKLLLLFELLNLLTKADQMEEISFQDYKVKDSLKASNRMEKIYTYIHINYNKDNISLSNLSENLHMTPSSTCKFIKKITKKTFSELLIETRINEACKLLSSTDKYISEICYISGFKNLSGFNRTFKKVMHNTPKEYREIYNSQN